MGKFYIKTKKGICMSSVTLSAGPLEPVQEQPIADAINSVKHAVSLAWTAAQPVISQIGQKAQAAYTEGKGYVTRNFSIHANGFFASSTTTIYYIAVTALSIQASYALSIASAFCNLLPPSTINRKINELNQECNRFFHTTSTKIKENFPIRIQGTLLTNIEAAFSDDILRSPLESVERHVTDGANWCNTNIKTVMFRLTGNADFRAEA
jgi:hypothetical protein